jgi:RNA polymerase sigma factor (TIGR02999 family)
METGPVTKLLRKSDGDEAGAKDELYGLVYERLKGIAGPIVGREGGQATQLTAVVHEVYLRLADRQYSGSEHFYSAAAVIVRNVLVDLIRTRRAAKRGGGVAPQSVDVVAPRAVSDPEPDHILDLHHALHMLKEQSDRERERHPTAAAILARQHEVVMLRFFAGLEWQQIGEKVGVSDRQAKRDWDDAKEFLKNCLAGYDTRRE